MRRMQSRVAVESHGRKKEAASREEDTRDKRRTEKEEEKERERERERGGEGEGEREKMQFF